MGNIRIKSLVLIVGLLLFSGVAYADEVLEAIQEAMDAYKEKAYTEAVEGLDYAKQLIQQLTSDILMKFLPEPMEGWKAKEAESQRMGMFGGSASIQREYWKPGSGKKGRGRVILDIMGESPMTLGMMAMFNPAVVGADGGKLQKIKRNKAIVKYKSDSRKGEIMINVAKKYMVIIKGTNVEKEELMYYATAVDYKGLKSLE